MVEDQCKSLVLYRVRRASLEVSFASFDTDAVRKDTPHRFLATEPVQVDTSGWQKPIVGIDLKVAF